MWLCEHDFAPSLNNQRSIGPRITWRCSLECSHMWSCLSLDWFYFLSSPYTHTHTHTHAHIQGGQATTPPSWHYYKNDLFLVVLFFLPCSQLKKGKLLCLPVGLWKCNNSNYDPRILINSSAPVLALLRLFFSNSKRKGLSMKPSLVSEWSHFFCLLLESQWCSSTVWPDLAHSWQLTPAQFCPSLRRLWKVDMCIWSRFFSGLFSLSSSGGIHMLSYVTKRSSSQWRWKLIAGVSSSYSCRYEQVESQIKFWKKGLILMQQTTLFFKGNKNTIFFLCQKRNNSYFFGM